MAEYVLTSSAYTSRVFGLATGLEGICRFRLIDNDTTADDPLYGPATAGIIEDPAGSGSYVFDSSTVSELSPATEGKFSRVWDSGAATDLVADEDMITVSGFTVVDISPGDSYATTDELFRILKIRAASAEQIAAAERVLIAATGEINAEIDLADAGVPVGWEVALAQEVCLERAVEHWRQQESPFGLLGLGAESGVAFASKDSWGRHAEKLAPLKGQWGLA